MRISTAAALVAVPLLSALPFACKTKGDDSGGLDANIVLTDANNYSYSGAVHVPVVTTASGTDITICWDQVKQDLQCHDLNPLTDIDNIGLARFPNKTQAQVEEGLSNNSLLQADINGYVEFNTDHAVSCTTLSSFSFLGTAIDVLKEYNQDGGTYMLMLTEGTEPGIGARVITFLQPQADSDVVNVDVPDNCGVLDFNASLQDLSQTQMPTDGPFVVDWSALTTDGIGAPLSLSTIDSVMLAYYAGKTPADLQSTFLDLELIADDMYTMDLPGGTAADLALATNAGGTTFPGFTGDGTWLFALRCSRCYNPAPVFLTVVAPQ